MWLDRQVVEAFFDQETDDSVRGAGEAIMR